MNPRILVADDDPDMLSSVASAMTQFGADVAVASSGAELLELLADAQFDLVVTDISMPWMTGLQVAHSARTAGMETPIIVMTALRDPDIPNGVRALGPNAVLLRKPFELTDLEQAASTLLERCPDAQAAC